jgi:hypothetical protein
MEKQGRLVAVVAAALFLLVPASVCGSQETGGGPLRIERVDLKFADGSSATVIERGGSLQAAAEVTFRGSGLLAGAWEIAEPTTTPGAPQFRILLRITRNLAGTGREQFKSPALPSAIPGSYLLRLTISRPSLPDGKLEVRYFVGEATGEAPVAQAAIPPTLTARGPSGTITARGETKFSWDPVPGSVAYQVEIYDKAGESGAGTQAAGRFNVCMIRVPSELQRPPTMGIMVPAYQTSAVLKQLAGSKLTSGRAYLWRVVAVAGDGKVLCQSPFREFLYSE